MSDYNLKAPERREKEVSGGRFVFGESETASAIWGSDDEVLWSSGEGLMIVGSDGTGKSTIAQQLVLQRLGLRTDGLLGYDVQADPQNRVLYMAMDRPEQIRRSLRRMVSEEDIDGLDENLIVHRGPPLFSVVNDPRALADLAEEYWATTVVIDSLKDLTAQSLNDDTVGQAVNRAYQEVIDIGAELLVLHHPRKANADNRKPTKLDDAYGSRWLRSGLGSILMLWAAHAGSTDVELYHAKPVTEPVGPLLLQHDHQLGRTTASGLHLESPTRAVINESLLGALVAAGSNGITLDQAVVAVGGKPSEDRDKAKGRRELKKLEGQSLARPVKGRSGGRNPGGEPGRWFAILGGES